MKKCVVLLFVLLLSSCISTPQKTEMATGNQVSTQEVTFESSGGRGPEYKGKIYAVKNPVSAKLKPTNLHGKFSIFLGSDDKDVFEIFIDQQISSFNNHLRWDVEYKEGSIGSDSINGSLLTDEYGKYLRMESPFSAKEEIKDNFLKNMENFLYYSSINMFLPKFNDAPIKTGDVFYTFIDLNEHFGELMGEDLKIKISPSKIIAILRGWANEGERKVLVAEIRGKSTWRDVTATPFSRHHLIYGYSLIDPVTFHVIKAEVNYTLADIPDDDDPMRISYSVEIE